MENLQKRAKNVLTEIISLWETLSVDQKITDLEQLNNQLAAPDVWQRAFHVRRRPERGVGAAAARAGARGRDVAHERGAEGAASWRGGFQPGDPGRDPPGGERDLERRRERRQGIHPSESGTGGRAG